MASGGILTIAIPTYNRADFLDRALKSIKEQMTNYNDLIRILVSDNCSTDHTEYIIEKHKSNGLSIIYIKNDHNKGADFNIRQCFSLSNTIYVLTLGDDDILEEGAIETIFTTIDSFPNFGIYHLGWRALNNTKLKPKGNKILYFDKNIGADFIDCISHNITFISANILNKKFLLDINTDKYLKSNLIQLPIFLSAVYNAEYNIVNTYPLIGVEPDNSGGFNVCQTFGQNLQDILSEFQKNAKKSPIPYIITTRLLVEAFPGWVYRIKTDKSTFHDDKNIHKILSPVYKTYPHYWLFTFPLTLLPAKVIKAIWKLYIPYIGLGRRFLSRKIKRKDFREINSRS